MGPTTWSGGVYGRKFTVDKIPAQNLTHIPTASPHLRRQRHQRQPERDLRQLRGPAALCAGREGLQGLPSTIPGRRSRCPRATSAPGMTLQGQLRQPDGAQARPVRTSPKILPSVGVDPLRSPSTSWGQDQARYLRRLGQGVPADLEVLRRRGHRLGVPGGQGPTPTWAVRTMAPPMWC